MLGSRLGRRVVRMIQPSIFDPDDGARRRDDGIQRADDHAVPDWKDEAYLAVIRVAARLGEFTSDDVWAELAASEVSTHEHRAMGAVIRRAARAGWCAPTSEFSLSRRPQRHRAPLRVWRSLRLEAA